jgi:hypothetical protein
MLGSRIVVTSASALRCGLGPYRSALRIPLHDLAGTGARNRRSPYGGSANGMPRKAAECMRQKPRTVPALVSTPTCSPVALGRIVSILSERAMPSPRAVARRRPFQCR